MSNFKRVMLKLSENKQDNLQKILDICSEYLDSQSIVDAFLKEVDPYVKELRKQLNK